MQRIFQQKNLGFVIASQLIFRRELNFLFLSVFLFAAAIGINLVTFPTILTKYKASAAQVGLSFTIDMLGGILMSFFLSRIVARFKMMKVMKFAVCGYGGILLLIYFCGNFYLWISLAFLMGALWFAYVITRQSWLNMLLEKERRGVGLGIFSMLISAGIAVGPMIVKFFGAENYFSFVISTTLALLSFLSLRPLQNLPNPEVVEKRIGLKSFFKRNPQVFLARFFLEFQTYLLLTLTVIFGNKIGLSFEAAGLLITSFMASGFCDVFVGFALRKSSPYKLIHFGFLGCLCCFAAMIFFRNYSFLIVAYFVFGICVACIYVSVFKVANDDYPEEKLVAANATFQIIGSGGALCGSLIGGVLFNVFGAIGFPITMVLSSIFYLSFSCLKMKGKNIY